MPSMGEYQKPAGYAKPCGCGEPIEVKIKSLDVTNRRGFRIEKPEYKGNAVLNANR
tara:strand:+ start:553 stop:720 length:168 start_codon:yes stop_codon:yes gene_type:complete